MRKSIISDVGDIPFEQRMQEFEKKMELMGREWVVTMHIYFPKTGLRADAPLDAFSKKSELFDKEFLAMCNFASGPDPDVLNSYRDENIWIWRTAMLK